jgi:hypothetical protein
MLANHYYVESEAKLDTGASNFELQIFAKFAGINAKINAPKINAQLKLH